LRHPHRHFRHPLQIPEGPFYVPKMPAAAMLDFYTQDFDTVEQPLLSPASGFGVRVLA
jgi:hypothetical protein